MKKIGTNGDVGEVQYREWPLFKEFRKTELFQITFEQVFDKPFTASESEKCHADNKITAVSDIASNLLSHVR